LVAHPSDHGSFGPLLDGNSLRPGNRPTSDRRCMTGDGLCDLAGEIRVIGVEGQERQHCPLKVFNILGLGLLSATNIGFFPLGMPFCGSFGC
jgi:hypothetical protein